MFKIKVHRVEDHTFILNLQGELTANSSAAFHKALIPILRQRPKAVSVNLTDIDTIDEAGITMLMSGLMGNSDGGIYFYLIGLPNKVREYYKARLQQFEHPFFFRDDALREGMRPVASLHGPASHPDSCRGKAGRLTILVFVPK